MSDSLSGYSLRRGYSPHRNSSRRRSSKTSCRKQGTPEEAQEETDSIFVATYNDNPKHLYGLDKNEDEEPPTEMIFKFNPFSDSKIDPYSKKSLFWMWLSVTLYILMILFLYNGILKTFQKNDSGKNIEKSNNMFQSLLDQINLQKVYLDQVSENIMDIQYKEKLPLNCSCQKANLDEFAHKSMMENLQEQILSTINVVKTMNEKVSKFQEDVKENQQAYQNLESKDNTKKELCNGEDCSSSSPNLYGTIQSALEHYHADTLGIPDFALESAGASINSPYHSETCDVGAPIIKVFGLPLWQDPRSPRNVIQPSTSPGNCWPMKGNTGYIVIKLVVPIEITMVTLEHLDRKLDRYSVGNYQLAPREFSVHAWLDKDGHEKFLLGSYVYLREHHPIQTFNIQHPCTKPISFVELRVSSNYGNQDCTCLYRFRVHGISSQWDDLDADQT